MQFTQLDRITELEAGKRIQATKCLSLGEEYLQDHFPNFPVMPGVLMLEAMFQAAYWLVRYSHDFQHAMVSLKEARNVKYADFVEPGETLVVTAEVLKEDESTTLLATKGTVDDKPCVSARLLLERFCFADRIPDFADSERLTRRLTREQFEIFCPVDLRTGMTS